MNGISFKVLSVGDRVRINECYEGSTGNRLEGETGVISEVPGVHGRYYSVVLDNPEKVLPYECILATRSEMDDVE